MGFTWMNLQKQEVIILHNLIEHLTILYSLKREAKSVNGAPEPHE